MTARLEVIKPLALPLYLQRKLAALQITSLEQISAYLEIFAQLKLHHPSLSFQALFDLYCLVKQISRANLLPAQQRQLILEFQQLPPSYPNLAAAIVNYNLGLAQAQAELAASAGEVPIGAVIIYQGQLIAQGYNRTRTDNNILAHAEIIAIQQAQQHLGNYRLIDCDLYVTIEPCLMCSGAIMQSRIKRLIFGANEPKTGACCSQYQVFNNRQTNHQTQVIGPIDQHSFSQTIRQFFNQR